MLLHRRSLKIIEVLGEFAAALGEKSSGGIELIGRLRGAAHDHYRFSELVLGIVKSAPFQMRVKEPRPSGSGKEAL